MDTNNFFQKFGRILKRSHRLSADCCEQNINTAPFYGLVSLQIMYRNLHLATVSEQPSPNATNYNIFYGDKVVYSQTPFPNLIIKYADVVIEKDIQDTFYRDGRRTGNWAHFIKLKIGDKAIDLVKNKPAADMVKNILIKLVSDNRIKAYDAQCVVRDDSWAYSR